MTLQNLIPSYWNNRKLQKREDNTMLAIQRQINDLFDGFFNNFSLVPFEELQKHDSFVPKVDIKETKKDIRVSAELPGMDGKDIDLTLTEGTLIIKGEKNSEAEDKKEGYHRIERSYGSFSRVIHLPEGIDEKKVEANYKKGVLKIVIPKTSKAQEKQKKIEVKDA